LEERFGGLEEAVRGSDVDKLEGRQRLE
jgi:hypothetical protein